MRTPYPLLLTLSGGGIAAFGVAILESLSVARGLAESGATTAASTLISFVATDAGVLMPLSLVIAIAVYFLVLIVEPERSAELFEYIRIVRSHPADRVRAAAITPLVILGMFVSTIGSGHAARYAVGHGAPAESGFTMAMAWVALSITGLLVAFALLPALWRIIGRYFLKTPVADPLVTGGATMLLVAFLFGLGIATGDPGGAGGLPGVGLFATLARPELDLRPVVYALITGAAAYLGGKLARMRHHRAATGLGVAIIVAGLGLCARSAHALNGAPELTGLLERSALGKLSLAALRRASDRDRDGYSPLFGGGDCNDHDKGVNPTAIDIPGNGIDEDCSGVDAPPPVVEPAPAPEPAASTAPATGPRRTYNVILITVDTLRADLGFGGYPRPVSPQLDRLAARSTVFERAYSMASYTAKSMGSMMIGKYASETNRNWDHFTTYFPTNTFITQRVRSSGAHTFAGHCHYYFHWPTGYQLGFNTFDASAIAPGMADNDSSTTSDRLSDLAIRMLSKPENTRLEADRRFFAWFHYFDPHAQYVHHDGAPDFASMPGGPPRRAIYDDEVWFTDKHIGRVIDFVGSQPWGADTAIIVTADHGEAFGDAHGVKTHGHELWESLVRIPLILYVPDATPKRVPLKRSSIDVAPTILDLVGGNVPAPGSELRGTSLLADTRGEPVERDVYLDMPEGPYNGVRRALISGPSPGTKLTHFGGNRYQLYDLAADPGENEDLALDPAKARPFIDRMEQLRARLKEVSVTGAHVGQ